MPSNGDVQNDANIKETILSQLKKLLTANLVVRLANFTFWKVSTSKEKKEAKEFIAGTRRYRMTRWGFQQITSKIRGL